ncbi:MAG TPA: peptidylprolyl isomerase [Dactylosporangium sp.]|jgi:peptidyl-prolyl cis-trans isomerase B (cyclophilin B)|nr:peptidylprolyl isomerase [Dactylosporangium sp.]
MRANGVLLVPLLALSALALTACSTTVTGGTAQGRPLSASHAAGPGSTSTAAGNGVDCRYTVPTETPDANTKAATKDVGVPPAKARNAGKAVMRLTTNLGPIVVDMDAKAAPCAVASFNYLAGKHFFDNTKCHRLTTAGIWVLQCGDPSATGYGGPTYRYAEENLTVPYTRGVVAIANTGEPASSASQFFINYKDNTNLDPLYTVLGTVTTGMDIVDKVAAGGATPSDPNSPSDGTPKVEIVLQQVTVSYA